MIELAKEVELLPLLREAPGRARKGEEEQDDSPSNFGAGNSSIYRLARIRRDSPETFKRCLNGDFVSVAQACRAAGIEKVTVKVVPTVDGYAASITEKLSKSEIRQLCQKIKGHC